MSVVQRLIAEHLDVWTTAETEKKSGRGRSAGNVGSVYGIRKLRELILELAVRGKLVPQDPSDEPASELLKRISVERDVQKKINKRKSPKQIAVEEYLYTLPKSWEWARLDNIVLNIISGGTPSKNHPEFWNGIVPWASVKDLNVIKFLEKTQDYITQEGLDAGSKLAQKGDVIICTRMGLGKIAIAAIDVAINQDLKALKITSLFNLNYFINFYRTLKISGSGMTVAGIKQDELLNFCLPTPPLAEQHRIVAKVDELMALCDQLESRHVSAVEAHEKLVSHLLGTLTDSQNAEDFADRWQRIAAHFDTLFTTEDSIDALKQTFLQLAVMGKLVPQDKSDEPAGAFLSQLGISACAILPAGWSETRLGKLGSIFGGATPSKAKKTYWDGDIPWVSPKDMKRLFIDDSEDKVSEAAIRETTLKIIPVGSLLMVVRGMILAHSFPVALTTREVTINQDMKALLLPDGIREYLLLYMRAMRDTFVAMVDRSSHGTCKLISEKLWATKIAIPPFSEQHRICAKVDELMAICDQLKSRIADASRLQQKLADALVEQAVA